MNKEKEITWDFLKNLADALDSYRVRALIDAQEEIIETGLYDEQQYHHILLMMCKEEHLKYSLFNFLKSQGNCSYDTLKKFSQESSMGIKKALSLLNLLNYENLIELEEIHESLNGDPETAEQSIFKDLKITVLNKDPFKIKPIYEPVKVIFDAKICSGCGMCAGICPVNCLEIYNGFGKIDEEKCIKCGLCYFVCPRSYLPEGLINLSQDSESKIKEYSKIGYYKSIYSARTKIKEISETCQDGGVSSTCLYYLLDKNEIDLAIGAKMSRTYWRPEPMLITNKDELLETTGTKYVNNPTLRKLNEINNKVNKIAIVGVPCMMQALLKSEIYNIGIPSLDKVIYRIGIFCMESFSYESLLKICEIMNVNINDAIKMDINKGKFFVYTKSGEEHAVPIKEVTHLAREDCEVCYDLTSESADISIGSIGSPSGWNTVIIRTDKGEKLYKELLDNDLIESKAIEDVKPGLPLLLKIAGSKKNKCRKHVEMKLKQYERVPNY